MKDFLQKVRNSGDAAAGGPRAALGVFGKHPGWNDHILGIGAETEGLAWLKQVLYVDGIGAQIDAGAWEKLPNEKRAEGFDHTFLWFRGGLLFLGILWSSRDGKGRAKYPMVVCLETQGVSPGFLLDHGLPALLALKDGCLAATSAEAVTLLCQEMQESFRQQLSQFAAQWNRNLPLEERRAFLNSTEFGAQRLGLSRVLHELGSTPGLLKANRVAGPNPGKQTGRVVRVPLASASATEALWRWAEFLRASLHESFDLALVARRDASWLDVVAGEPCGPEFFFLQASLDAMPRASDVPYHLAPELDQWLLDAEARFYGNTVPLVRGGAGIEIQPPIPSLPASPGAPVRVSKGKIFALVAAGLVLFFLLAGIIAALVKPRIEKHQPAPEEKLAATNSVSVPSPPSHPEPAAPQPYDQEIHAAQNAHQQSDFTNAIHHAEAALRLRPGDTNALKVLADARRSLGQALTAAIQREQQRTQAVTLAALTPAANAAQPPATVAAPARPSAQTSSTPALGNAPPPTNRPISTSAPAVSPASTPVPVAAPSNLPAVISTGIGIDFIWVPALKVRVAKCEITQRQYSSLMGNLPAGQFAENPNLPVSNVSCDEARAFCSKLSAREKQRITLPSETEYLALLGLASNQVANAYAVLHDSGAFAGEATGPALAAPRPVGSGSPRANGIFDLIGNVREWVEGADACKSAGFAFNLGGGRTRSLLLKPTSAAPDAWIQAATGIRCVLRDP